MKIKRRKFAAIKKDVAANKKLLDQIHEARQAVRGYTTVPLAQRGANANAVRAFVAKDPAAHRMFNLLAQGDSWFDYPPGTDLIDCLHSKYGHTITNIAVAGSTLNDEAYGPVPREMFGLPFGPKQSDDPDRITELVHHIQQGSDQGKFQGLLLSAGGNDVAGDEFFSFINNARSGLTPVNAEVLDGVVNGTCKTAYLYLIDTALKAANDPGFKIFTHGYDYPWPDGRGVIHFLGWKVGPWFDPTFNEKNYPYEDEDTAQLQARHDIIVKFIDAVNDMLAGIAADVNYKGKVFHADLRGTLKSADDWANELHPVNSGFSALADVLDASLQANM